MTKHVKFLDIVNKIAESSWGSSADPDKVEKDLVDNPVKLQAFASLELLKRLNAIARYAGADEEDPEPQVWEPRNPKAFPDLSIGARLYEFCSYDMELRECVIIARDDGGRCLCATLNDFDLKYPQSLLRIADADFFPTPHEAVAHKVDASIVESKADIAKWTATKQAAAQGAEKLQEFLSTQINDDN